MNLWFFGPRRPDTSVPDLTESAAPRPFADVAGIVDKAESVSFLGVEIEKRPGGPNVPDLERFRRNVLTDHDLRLMQKIAVALELNQPLLIESGSGLGKSESVERMCAMLDWECYYANCHDFDAETLIGCKTLREDTRSGFGWVDGVVVQAIRNGGVLFLDEYNFMRGEVRGRLHEVLDAILRGKSEIVLVENDGERVPVHPDFRIVAAQNPPGGKFSDREVLDEAQFSRFVYLKEPSTMPNGMKLARLYGMIDSLNGSNISQDEYLVAGTPLDRRDLGKLPDIKIALKKYLEFINGIEQLVNRGDLAADQPQDLHFSFQRDTDRVFNFIRTFYDGDLAGTMRKALRFYFRNKFENPRERKTVDDLIDATVDFRPESSKRINLGGSGDMMALGDGKQAA